MTQFIHLEAVSITRARALAAEAERVAEFSSHVGNARTADLLYGTHPIPSIQLLERLTRNAVDAAGRRLSAKARVAIALVASWPDTCESSDWAEVQAWTEATVGFLKAYFGKHLRSVVMHTDESHPHVHAIIYEDIGADHTLSLKNSHPGIKHEELLHKRSRMVWTEGMVMFQDAYHRTVGSPFGQARKSDSPRARVQTREAYVAGISSTLKSNRLAPKSPGCK